MGPIGRAWPTQRGEITVGSDVVEAKSKESAAVHRKACSPSAPHKETHLMRQFVLPPAAALLAAAVWLAPTSGDEPKDKLNQPPKGFTALFNGKDLTGWQIAVAMNERK